MKLFYRSSVVVLAGILALLRTAHGQTQQDQPETTQAHGPMASIVFGMSEKELMSAMKKLGFVRTKSHGIARKSKRSGAYLLGVTSYFFVPKKKKASRNHAYYLCIHMIEGGVSSASENWLYPMTDDGLRKASLRWAALNDSMLATTYNVREDLPPTWNDSDTYTGWEQGDMRTTVRMSREKPFA